MPLNLESIWQEFMKSFVDKKVPEVDDRLPKLVSQLALYFSEKATELLKNEKLASVFEDEACIAWVNTRVDEILDESEEMDGDEDDENAEPAGLTIDQVAEMSALFFVMLLTPMTDEGEDDEEIES